MPTRIAVVRRVSSRATAFAVLMLMAGCGASDSVSVAAQRAKDRAREDAQIMARTVGDTLHDANAPHGKALLDLVVRPFRDSGGFRIFATNVSTGDAITVDAAIDAGGQSDGFAPAHVLGRLCVRLSGVRANADVTLSDVRCADSLPPVIKGTADRVIAIHLHD